MNSLYQLNIDDVLEIYERAKNNGKIAGDSIEEELIAYVKEKGINPLGHTELNKEELIKEYVSHDKTILNIDQEGVKIIKQKGEDV